MESHRLVRAHSCAFSLFLLIGNTMVHEHEYYLSLDDDTTVYVFLVEYDAVHYELSDGTVELVSIWDFTDRYVLA